jgi:hypothetical protein
VIYGEVRRKFLLKKLVQNCKLAKILINCNECARLARTVILMLAGIFLCLSHCGADWKFLLLKLSFAMLIVEPMIPTRRL